MCLFFKRMILIVFCVAGLWLTWLPASADQCLAPSPTVKAGKDPYAGIEVRNLTPDERDSVKALLRSLDGRWAGEGSEMICTSVSNPQSRESDNFTIDAEITVDYYSNLKLEAGLYSAEKKTSSQEIIRLYLRDDRLRLNNDSGLGLIELIDIKPDLIHFRKNRVKTMKDGASLRQESFYTLAVDAKGTLRIETTVYFQARLYSRTVWLLRKT